MRRVAVLLDAGVRVSVDRNADKVGAKIRLARLDRVPYMLIIGAREAESGTVSVRHRDRDDLGAMPQSMNLSVPSNRKSLIGNSDPARRC